MPCHCREGRRKPILGRSRPGEEEGAGRGKRVRRKRRKEMDVKEKGEENVKDGEKE